MPANVEDARLRIICSDQVEFMQLYGFVYANNARIAEYLRCSWRQVSTVQQRYV